MTPATCVHSIKYYMLPAPFVVEFFFYPAFYVLLSNNREPYTRSRIDLIYVSTASAITECVLSTLSLTDYLTAWTRMIVIIYVS